MESNLLSGLILSFFGGIKRCWILYLEVER